MTRTACTGVSAVLGFLLLAPAAAFAHAERPVQFPSGLGRVPVYRTSGPTLVVCKPDSLARVARYPKDLKEFNRRLFVDCQRRGFHNIQDAINAVREPGTRILVLPGVYEEEPSLAPPAGACAALAGTFPLSYEEQQACPHLDNLIGIFGDGPDADIACDGRLCDLQIEGTGLEPGHVVIDGGFQRLNVIRADRADGVYFRNFTIQHSSFNSLYVIETGGFVIDRLVGRWNDEYAFLTFATDHGLYMDCEAYGNGDSGIYPGSASDLHGERHAVEITRCRSHHNLLGLSGTAGNSLLVHDNDFFNNTVGISLDSVFPNHPGLPQERPANAAGLRSARAVRPGQHREAAPPLRVRHVEPGERGSARLRLDHAARAAALTDDSVSSECQVEAALDPERRRGSAGDDA